MAQDPGEVYGEPKFPERMNYVTTTAQRAAIGEVSRADGITLGEAQRRLIEEALDMREQQAKAEQEFAESEEGSEVCEVVGTPEGTALVRGPRSLGGVPVGLARVGDQLARQRPVGGGGTVPVMSRAQLMAQERGEVD